MKRTASLETLITALILLTVAGIQYSADQQKKVTLFARGADDMKNQSVLARDMATHRELDRDEAALGWVAIAAAGFLVRGTTRDDERVEAILRWPYLNCARCEADGDGARCYDHTGRFIVTSCVHSGCEGEVE